MKRLVILLVTLIILVVGFMFYFSYDSVKVNEGNEGNTDSEEGFNDLVTGEEDEEEMAEEDEVDEDKDEIVEEEEDLADIQFVNIGRGGGFSGGSGGGAPVYESVSLDVKIINNGQVSVGEKFKIAFYDFTDSENPVFLEEKDVEALDVGSEISIAFSSEGNEGYSQTVIRIVLDSEEVIEELHEENNIAVSYPTHTVIYPVLPSSSSSSSSSSGSG